MSACSASTWDPATHTGGSAKLIGERVNVATPSWIEVTARSKKDPERNLQVVAMGVNTAVLLFKTIAFIIISLRLLSYFFTFSLYRFNNIFVK